jgi:two-component system, NarL family, nitrate/nitrite response regulator NarL
MGGLRDNVGGTGDHSCSTDAEQTVTCVVIVTPVRLYREGLAHVLGGVATVDVVGVAADPDEALSALLQREPDVVLLDVPVAAATSTVHHVVGVVPHARVVALGVQETEAEVLAWAEAGAHSYVSCESSIDELVAAVEAAGRGELLCSAAIAGALLRRVGRLAAAAGGGTSPADRLTLREQEIVDLMARGLSNKQIAHSLDIALPTVKNHVRNIFEKLEVHRRADALLRLGRRVPPVIA